MYRGENSGVCERTVGRGESSTEMKLVLFRGGGGGQQINENFRIFCHGLE